MDFALGPSREIVIAGDLERESTRQMVETIHRAFLPNRVLMHCGGSEDAKRLAALAPFIADLQPNDKEPKVYICENYACRSPITNPDELRQALGSP